jgi:hypothetical protein
MDLFGRSGVSLLPLLRSDLKAVGDQATVLSDQTVLAADKFDDLYGRIKNFGKAVVGEGIFGPLVRWADNLSKSFDDVSRSVDVLRGKMDSLPKVAPAALQGMGSAPPTMSVDEALKLSDQLTTKVEAQIRATEGASARLRESWVADVKRISDAISGAPIVKDLKQWTEALQKPGAAAKVLADEGLRDQLGSAIDTVTKKFGSLKAAGVSSLNPIAAALKAMGQQAETIPPKIIETMGAFTLVSAETRDWGAENVKTTATLLEMVNTGRVFADDVGPRVFKGMREEAARAGVEVVTVGKSIEDAFARIPSILANAFTGGGGLAGGLKAIGITIADAILTPLVKGLGKVQMAAVSTGSAMAAALGGSAGGGTAGQVAGIASSLGGAALAASAWGTSMAAAGVAGTVALGAATLGIGAAAVGAYVLIKRLTDSKGRDAVKKFAEDNGGFDALREKMNALGADGERLWVDLTQKVGKGNLEQANSAIAAIQAALDAHAVKAMETEALIGASQQRESDAIDAATAGVRSRIADLATEYDSLFKSIENEAPEEVMGVVEQAVRARMAAVAEQSKQAKEEEDSITEKIKENMGDIGIAARDARGELEDAFANIIIPPVRVPIEFIIPDLPHLGSGGIVTRPTLALIGESGPEAVVPLGGGGFSGGKSSPGDVYLGREVVGQIVTRDQGKRYRGRTKVGAA